MTVVELGVLPTLAVVPFEFSDENKSHLDVIGEILANNIITLLTRSLHIKVISRLSTTKFRNIDWSFAEIKASLNCDFVLFGSYKESNNELHIVFRLTNIGTDTDIWSDEIRCTVRDILDAESPLVENLASTAAKRIFESKVSQPTIESLDSLETHALYISAINYMHSENANEFLLAKDCFLRIIERQPNHSTVHANLALWYLLQIQRSGGWSLRFRDSSSAIIRDYIDKSLALNPGNEYALALKGTIEVQLFKNIDLGVDLAREALASNQNDPRIQSFSSLAFMSARQYQDAANCIDKAIELSPIDPQLEFFYSVAAAGYYHTGRFTLAEQYARSAIELNPKHTSPFRTIIATQMAINEPTMARASAKRLMIMEPEFTVESWLKHWSGDPGDGRQIAAHLSAAGIPRW